LFKPFDIDIKKPASIQLANKTQNIVTVKLKEFVRKRLIDLSYLTGKELYNRNGTNNYNFATRCVYKKIKKQRCARKGKYGSIHQIEAIWWCLSQYGKDVMQKVVK